MQHMHVNTWLQWHRCPLVGRLVPIRLHSTSSHSTVRSCSKPNIFHCKTMVKYIVLTKLPSDSIALHPHHLCRAAAVPIHCKCTMYNLLQHSGYWSVSRPISLQWSALALEQMQQMHLNITLLQPLLGRLVLIWLQSTTPNLTVRKCSRQTHYTNAQCTIYCSTPL